MSAHPRVRALLRDYQGTSAVEFALVAFPLIYMILGALQMGLFYMTQSSLDAGVSQTADTLVNSFNGGATPTIPTALQLKTMVVTKSGGLVRNNAALFVELRLFATLSASTQTISNTVDASTAGSILALRAQASVPVIAPGFGALAIVRSATLVRRQNY